MGSKIVVGKMPSGPVPEGQRGNASRTIQLTYNTVKVGIISKWPSRPEWEAGSLDLQQFIAVFDRS